MLLSRIGSARPSCSNEAGSSLVAVSSGTNARKSEYTVSCWAWLRRNPARTSFCSAPGGNHGSSGIVRLAEKGHCEQT